MTTTTTSTTSASSTAQVIQDHDFSFIGNGYAMLRAAIQITRFNGMEKLSSLISAFQDQLRQLERLRDLRLSDRLQGGTPLIDPDSGQTLGIRFQSGTAALQADLASVGLTTTVQSWQSIKVIEETSPPSSLSSYVTPQQASEYIGLVLALSGRELAPLPGARQFEFYSTASGKSVRIVTVIGNEVLKTIATSEVDRLRAAVGSLTTQLVNGAQQFSAELAALQLTTTSDWVHGTEVDEFQQERIRRVMLGLANTP